MNLLDEKLKEVEAAHAIIWKGPDSRKEFFNRLQREVGIISGQFVLKSRGTAIVDIDGFLQGKMQEGGYMKVRHTNEKYVSPYVKRSADTLSKHVGQMKGILNAEFKKSYKEFTSDAVKDKVVEILAKNFLAYDAEAVVQDGKEVQKAGIRYRKIHEDAIVSMKSWSLDDLLFDIKANHLIDGTRSDIMERAAKAELKAHAMKLANDPKSDREILTLIDRLEKLEGPARAGKTLDPVDESELNSELKKKVLVEVYGGKVENTMQLPELQALSGYVGTEISKVNSLEPVIKAVGEVVNEVQASSQPTQWEM